MSVYKLNFAASRKVNPPGIHPKLTEAQVWRGLEIKARDPSKFIATVTSCDIISDQGDKLVRNVSFGNNPPMKEEIELYNGTIAYFDGPSAGTRITNIISYDETGDLILTFSFAGGIPGYNPNGDVPSPQELNKYIGTGIEITVQRIRELVTEGSLVLA